MADPFKRLLSSARYKVGAFVEGKDGRTFTISSINTKARQIVLTGLYGETYVYLSDEFRNKIASNDLKLVICKENKHGCDEVFKTHDLSPTEIASRDERQVYIGLVLKYIDSHTWPETYDKIKKELPDEYNRRSIRTVQRYWKLYKEGYSPDCLAAKFSARGIHRSLAMDPVIEDIIFAVLENRYCNSSRFSIQDIVHEINRKCDAKSAELNINLGGVSRRTISRLIKKLSLKKLKGRLSPNTFRLMMRNAKDPHKVEEPFARVEIDAATLPIFIVDAHGHVIGCPTFYAMIDTASMIIVGIFLTILPPSQVGVLQTFEFAFSPKGESFRIQHECINSWPAPADIRTLVMDNGADFHGPMVVKASQHLSMMLEYCVANSPYQKPFIERFFGTLNTMLIKKLPGAKFSHDKNEEHAIANGLKTANLTLNELNGIIIRWITDTYHIKESDRHFKKFGEECSPLKALDILSQLYPVFPAPSSEELLEACRHTLDVKLKVTREGINYQRQQYQAEYVSELYKTNSTVTVTAAINPLDCSSIYIYDKASKKWVVVPNKNPNMPRISFEQAKQYRKQRGKSDLEMSRETHNLNQAQLIEDANAKKSRKGRVAVNRKAERDIQKAQASLSANSPQQERVVSAVPSGPTETASQPHRRKK